MKTIGFTILLVAVLTSCSKANDQGKLYVLENMQRNSIEQFSYGEEMFSSMKEMAEDRTENELARSRFKMLYNQFILIDSLTGIQIAEIEKMKRQMFRSFGEEMSIKKEQSILHYDYKNDKTSRPVSYDLKNVKHTGSSNLLNEKNRLKLIVSFRKLRREICSLITTSINYNSDSKQYSFIDPNITDFKNEKDFWKQYDLKIKQSTISPDDTEVVKRIYHLLSKRENDWKLIFNEKESWMDDMTVLLALENDIQLARSLAFNVILNRITNCASYDFTQILPSVYGPNAAIEGDTITLQIFMAAMSENKMPIVNKLKGGILAKTEKGVAFVKVIVPSKKETEIKGMITILNKSGIPLTREWNHPLRILKKQ